MQNRYNNINKLVSELRKQLINEGYQQVMDEAKSAMAPCKCAENFIDAISKEKTKAYVKIAQVLERRITSKKLSKKDRKYAYAQYLLGIYVAIQTFADSKHKSGKNGKGAEVGSLSMGSIDEARIEFGQALKAYLDYPEFKNMSNAAEKLGFITVAYDLSKKATGRIAVYKQLFNESFNKHEGKQAKEWELTQQEQEFIGTDSSYAVKGTGITSLNAKLNDDDSTNDGDNTDNKKDGSSDEKSSNDTGTTSADDQANSDNKPGEKIENKPAMSPVKCAENFINALSKETSPGYANIANALYRRVTSKRLAKNDRKIAYANYLHGIYVALETFSKSGQTSGKNGKGASIGSLDQASLDEAQINFGQSLKTYLNYDEYKKMKNAQEKIGFMTVAYDLSKKATGRIAVYKQMYKESYKKNHQGKNPKDWQLTQQEQEFMGTDSTYAIKNTGITSLNTKSLKNQSPENHQQDANGQKPEKTDKSQNNNGQGEDQTKKDQDNHSKDAQNSQGNDTSSNGSDGQDGSGSSSGNSGDNGDNGSGGQDGSGSSSGNSEDNGDNGSDGQDGSDSNNAKDNKPDTTSTSGETSDNNKTYQQKFFDKFKAPK